MNALASQGRLGRAITGRDMHGFMSETLIKLSLFGPDRVEPSRTWLRATR